MSSRAKPARAPELTEAHEEKLKKLRIHEHIYKAAKLQSVSTAQANEHLGRNKWKGNLQGLMYPCLGADGSAKGFRIRRDHPEIEDGEEKNKYVWSNDQPHLYFEATSRQWLSDMSVPVAFEEAYTSALAVRSWCERMNRPYLVIATAGCWGWHGKIGKKTNEHGERVDEKGPLPDLYHVPFTGGREAVNIPDSNYHSNSHVRRGVDALARFLQGRGSQFRRATIPAEGGVNGPDDYLATHTDEEFRAILDSAQKMLAADDEERLQALAKVDAIEYDRQRKQAAESLGIRPETLDREVAKRRPHSDAASHATAGHPIALRDPEPSPQPVDGAALLEEMRMLILRYAVLPPGAEAALPLWALHTYALDAAEHSPRLCVTAPEKGCGKTLVLDLLDALSRRPLASANTTAAATFRLIEAHQPTLLIDEADTFLPDNADLRSVLNSGFWQAKAFVTRCVGDDHKPMQFSTWCPVAIALIGRLPATLYDRSILVTMRRKKREERVERLRHDRLMLEASDIQRRAVRWAGDHIDELREADPAMPDTLTNRAADIWRSLFAIADCAGGQWPELARRSAIIMMRDREDASIAAQLLGDIRELFDSQRTDRFWSETVVKHLTAMENRPWADWKNGKAMTQPQLARQLKPFGVSPIDLRIGDENKKGYRQEQFTDAFARYLEDQSATPLQPAPDLDLSAISKRYKNENVAAQKSLQATPDVDCSAVAFWKTGGGQ